jgi:hypothetical protein
VPVRVRFGLIVGGTLAAMLVCWAAMIGRYGGPDEPAHVLRAHAVAHGDLLGAAAPGLAPGYRTVVVPAPLGTGDPSCYRHDATVPSTCAAGELDGLATVATSAGINPPLYYALVGLPPRLLGAADDPLAYRLSALGLVSVVLGLVAVRLRLRGDLAVLAPTLIVPSCWFLWGVVNPNSLEIALVALAATGIGRARTDSSSGRGAATLRGGSAWWVSIPLALAVSMRPIAAAWAVAVIVLAELEDRASATWRRRLVLSTPLVVAVVGVMAWNSWIGLVIDDGRTARTGSTLTALRESIGGLPRTGAELVASMGWLEFWAPWLAVVAWVVALLTLGVITRPRCSRGTWGVLGAALVLVPVVFEVVLYDRIGPIWQGRYSLPVAAIAIVVCLQTGNTSASLGVVPRRVVVAIVGLASVGMVVSFWATARRYSVGTEGSWWLGGADHTSRWFTPGTWVIVFAVLVASVAVLLLRGTVRSTQREPHPLGQTM